TAEKALNVFRDEPMVSVAEVFLPNGKRLATYRRAASDPISGSAGATLPLDPAGPKLFARGGHIHITAPVVQEGRVLGFIHIVVVLDALYPGWPGYLLIILTGIAAAVGVSCWLAARLQQQISG